MTAPASAQAGSQTRRASMIEAVTNVVVGYLLALATQRMLFPLFGIHITLTADGIIAAVFAVTSLCRSYWLRRLFAHIGECRDRREAERQRSLERRFMTGRL
jgi:Na+-driven multidrug efflux pump